MYHIDVNFTGEVVGNVSFTYDSAGLGLARFVIVHAPAYYDSNENQWVEGAKQEIHCVARNVAAEAIANGVSTGDKVMVFGALRLKSIYDDAGNVVDQINEVVIKDVGHSLVAEAL